MQDDPKERLQGLINIHHAAKSDSQPPRAMSQVITSPISNNNNESDSEPPLAQSATALSPIRPHFPSRTPFMRRRHCRKKGDFVKAAMKSCPAFLRHLEIVHALLAAAHSCFCLQLLL